MTATIILRDGLKCERYAGQAASVRMTARGRAEGGALERRAAGRAAPRAGPAINTPADVRRRARAIGPPGIIK